MPQAAPLAAVQGCVALLALLALRCRWLLLHARAHALLRCRGVCPVTVPSSAVPRRRYRPAAVRAAPSAIKDACSIVDQQGLNSKKYTKEQIIQDVQAPAEEGLLVLEEGWVSLAKGVLNVAAFANEVVLPILMFM